MKKRDPDWLKHDAEPGYRPVFYIAVAATLAYWAGIFYFFH